MRVGSAELGLPTAVSGAVIAGPPRQMKPGADCLEVIFWLPEISGEIRDAEKLKVWPTVQEETQTGSSGRHRGQRSSPLFIWRA